MTRPSISLLRALVFEGARGLPVRAELVPRVRGLDADGDLVVAETLAGEQQSERGDASAHLTLLTPCCHATATGVDTTHPMVCRACARPVAPKFGDDATIAFALLPPTDAEYLAARQIAALVPSGLTPAQHDHRWNHLDDVVIQAASDLGADAIGAGRQIEFLTIICGWDLDDVIAALDVVTDAETPE